MSFFFVGVVVVVIRSVGCFLRRGVVVTHLSPVSNDGIEISSL